MMAKKWLGDWFCGDLGVLAFIRMRGASESRPPCFPQCRDLVAVHDVAGDRRVALASFTAYAFSHTLGFASIIGPSIRYRIYTPMGLPAGEVAETSAFVIVRSGTVPMKPRRACS